ncbi:hypothetical protein [Massilia sp. KIM]|uniref:hypothetical protein n=1 Tax=Massilia sp. KIM TaxID=1955422 RepID=UPI001180CE83|nr:hypothetical protein [Massilia sp. KIM]
MTVTLDVVFFNYLDRFIYDAYIDGKAGAVSAPYRKTGGASFSGVRLKLGPKTVTWRLDGPEGMPRNGEKVVAKNWLALADLAPDAEFLGVHIYPDETVELIPSRHYPVETEKGKAMAAGSLLGQLPTDLPG